ncbi:MAG: ribosome silencing factor [Vicinamibacterales bacterium]|nr:ribosome silencing factor [Vicinamibacterales bacterium]
MAKSETPKPRRTPKLPKDVQAAVDAALDKKAIDLVVLDLHKAGAFTDYFIICTGQNARQVQAIADAVETTLKARKVRPSHVEGYDRAEWVLVDYFDFIVHVFTPGARNFYSLERLWGDAVRIEFTEGAPPVTTRARTTKAKAKAPLDDDDDGN